MKNPNVYSKIYVLKLEKTVTKLQRQIAALEADNFTLRQRVKSLAAQLKKQIALTEKYKKPTEINLVSHIREVSEKALKDLPAKS